MQLRRFRSSPAAPFPQPLRRLDALPEGGWGRRLLRVRARLGPRLEAPQPDIEEIFGARPDLPLRHTLYVVAALVVSLATAAALVRFDVVVSAPGRLLADAPTIVLQPLQLSIIRDLRVKAGDTVRKGDVVAALDPTFAQADQSALLAQQAALAAETERLGAELDGREPHFVGNGPDVAIQESLFRQRRSQFEAQLRAFDAEIQRLTGNIATSKANAVSLRLQFDVYNELEGMYAKLYAKSIASRVTYLGSSVSRLKAERDSHGEQDRIGELTNQLTTKQAERQVFVDKWRSDLMDALVRARREQASLSENLVKAARVTDLIALRAPEDGIVLDVARRSVGSVVQAAEPVVTLLPARAPLYAEVAIGSAEVGYAKAGDGAKVKVDAFPYQRHGMLAGHVRTIGMDAGATSLGPSAAGPAALPPGGVQHRGQIVLDDLSLRDMPEGARLLPGMSVTAEIKVGTRSVISYFTEPLRRGVDESMREP
ncbi:HlyD family type I secretion periplasmic adaptor subunit [Methylobacterium sp. JK268]